MGGLGCAWRSSGGPAVSPWRKGKKTLARDFTLEPSGRDTPGHTPLKSPEIHPTVCCLVQTSFVKGTDFQFSLVLEPSPDGTIKVWESGVTMALA